MKHLQLIIEDKITGEQICACCGIVLEEKINVPSIQGFKDAIDAERKQHTQKLTYRLHDGGLGSVAVGDSTALKINKLQSKIRYTRPGERRLAETFIILNKITSTHHTPRNVSITAFSLCRYAEKMGILYGRVREPFCHALLYAAYRITENQIELRKFIKHYKIQKNSTFKKYIWLVTERFNLPVIDMVNFVGKIIYKNPVNLSKRTINLAIDVLHDAYKQKLLDSIHPSVIAATCTYIAIVSTDTFFHLDDIAEAFNISVPSMVNRKTKWRGKLTIPNIKYVSKYYKKQNIIGDVS